MTALANNFTFALESSWVLQFLNNYIENGELDSSKRPKISNTF